MDVKRIVKFNCPIYVNKFAYLTNILYLLQIIFVTSTKKNKYLLHLQIIYDPYICKWTLLKLWQGLVFIANFFSS